MSFPKNKINLEVLLYALSQQLKSLPPDLQQSLTEIGQALQANLTDENKIEIRELVSRYQPLEIVYRKALTQWNQSYVSQERTKSLSSAFPIRSGLDELSIESLLLPANDWVSAAKQLVNNLSSPQTPAQFWDKTDRMAVMVAGGIALGSMVAQLPGAIIGGVVAAGYGWYIGFSKTKHSDKSTLIQLSSEEVAQPDRQLPLTSPDEVENLFWSREAHEYITEQSKKFDEMLPELIERYAGEYILFEDGRVIDTDIDEDMLLDRVWKTDFVKDRIAKYNSVFCHLVPSAEPYIEAVGNA
jgi:hypothetical protein